QQIAVITITPAVGYRNAARELLRHDRSREMRLVFLTVEIPVPRRDDSTRGERRLARKDLDRTSGGVAPEQGSLRPFVDFDVIDIHEVKRERHLARFIYPVDVISDIRLVAGI